MKNRIKELRQENNLTLRQLGAKLDMKNSTLSQYETGKRDPNDKIWQKLADFFHVPISYLRGESNPNRIKKMRQVKGVSQQDVAKALGLTRQAIALYETGQREPKLETWQKLANYFGVSVLTLMGINETATSKIEPAELNAITINLYKGEDVYNFIKLLDVDRPTALKILNFIQDYSEGFNQSQKSDLERYERKINMLEGELDDAADQLRQIIAKIEEE